MKKPQCFVSVDLAAGQDTATQFIDFRVDREGARGLAASAGRLVRDALRDQGSGPPPVLQLSSFPSPAAARNREKPLCHWGQRLYTEVVQALGSVPINRSGLVGLQE